MPPLADEKRAATEPTRPVVLAAVSDLMLAERLESAAHHVGCDLRAVADTAALTVALNASHPDLVILDLTDRMLLVEPTLGILNQQDPRPKVLACYPHVRKDLEATAEQFGCDIVMPRSRFLLDLPAALRLGLGWNGPDK